MHVYRDKNDNDKKIQLHGTKSYAAVIPHHAVTFSDYEVIAVAETDTQSTISCNFAYLLNLANE